MEKIFLKGLFVLVFLQSCSQKSKIPISNNLEIALDDELPQYIVLLNGAVGKDTASLSSFFRIDYIYDAAYYDHGYILYQLLGIYGDYQFSISLGKLSKTELINVRRYIEAGIDSDEEGKEVIINSFPLSNEYLGFENF